MISKIIPIESVENRLKQINTKNKTVVFTNGCFDILHVGHVRYLEAAREQGDILIIGLNSDISVRTIKGVKRPIISQDQRAELLSALWFVDFVVMFDEPDPLRLIKIVKPNILVKGEDWTEDKIIGADFVKSNGGKVVRVNIVPDTSTSEIINKILDRYKD